MGVVGGAHASVCARSSLLWASEARPCARSAAQTAAVQVAAAVDRLTVVAVTRSSLRSAEGVLGSPRLRSGRLSSPRQRRIARSHIELVTVT